MKKIKINFFFQRNLWLLLVVSLLGFPLGLEASEIEDLSTILHQLEQVSPQLRLDKANIAESKAGIDKASSEYWGRITLYGQDIHYNNNRLVSPLAPPVNFSQVAVDSNQYSYGANLSLPLDINGKITAKVHAQRHLNEASHFALANSRLQLFSQAVFLYRSLQQLSGVREALNKQHQALLEHYQVTKTAISVGRLAKVELLRIKAEIKAVEGQLAAINGDDSRLRANLAALLNQAQYTKLIVQAKSTPTPLVDVNDESLQQRPDIQRFNRLTKAEKESAKGVYRNWLPSLSVQANVAENSGYNGERSGVWSVVGQLDWELWDGGRRMAQISQANAKIQAVQQQKVLAANQAKAEFDAATAGWIASQRQFEAAQAGLQAAIETEKIQSDRYQNGRLSSVDLLDAESVLAKARSNLSSAIATWWLADDQLNLALGREPQAYLLQVGK